MLTLFKEKNTSNEYTVIFNTSWFDAQQCGPGELLETNQQENILLNITEQEIESAETRLFPDICDY